MTSLPSFSQQFLHEPCKQHKLNISVLPPFLSRVWHRDTVHKLIFGDTVIDPYRINKVGHMVTSARQVNLQEFPSYNRKTSNRSNFCHFRIPLACRKSEEWWIKVMRWIFKLFLIRRMHLGMPAVSRSDLLGKELPYIWGGLVSGNADLQRGRGRAWAAHLLGGHPCEQTTVRMKFQRQHQTDGQTLSSQSLAASQGDRAG